MKIETLTGFCAATLAAWACIAGTTSDATFVFVNPDASSFWRTAPRSTVTLPIVFPDGATSANLSVRGPNYSRDYTGLADGSYDVTLPAATDATDEGVYEFTLTFVGNASVTNTARLGVLAGTESGAGGSAPCLVGEGSTAWTKAYPRSVLPIPYGTTSFAVNGAEVAADDVGFTGAQGWYALPGLAVGETVDLALATADASYDVSLTVRKRRGLTFVFR